MNSTLLFAYAEEIRSRKNLNYEPDALTLTVIEREQLDQKSNEELYHTLAQFIESAHEEDLIAQAIEALSLL